MRNIPRYHESDTMDGDSQLLADFEAHLRQSGLARNTVLGYAHDMRGFLAWLETHESPTATPTDFTSQDVETFKQHLQVNLGRSPASINRTMQSMRKFGRFALQSGLRDSDPAQEVSLVGQPNKPVPRVLGDDEVATLLEAASRCRPHTSHRDTAILRVLLETGIRVGELVNLRVGDVNLTDPEPTLTIRRQRKRPARTMPLGDATQGSLARYLESTGPRRDQPSHLFLSRTGRPLSIRSVQEILTRLGEEAGLEVSAMTLRDTYAVALWQATGDIGMLTERLGNARPETALRYVFSPTNRNKTIATG